MDTLTWIWLMVDVACLALVVSTHFKNVLPGLLQDLMVYGKARQNKSMMDIHWSRQLLLVSHRYFIHFYALGLLWNVFLLATFLKTIIRQDTSYQSIFGLLSTNSSQVDCSSVVFTLVLLTIQLMRRLYESLFVSSFSGKMHLGHYVIGVAFYGLVNLTVVAEIPKFLSQGWYKTCQKPYHQVSWLHFLTLLLFLWASYHQYKCHAILGRLSSWTSDGKKIYKIPYGDWFNHVSSPHYFAEILIYIALFMAMGGQCSRWILVLIFVVLNLTLSAQNTHSWYKQKFEDYPRNRYIILPYVY